MRKTELMWPSRWLTPIQGMLHGIGKGLGKGETHQKGSHQAGSLGDGHAIQICGAEIPADWMASSTTGAMASMCLREASSGTTPP